MTRIVAGRYGGRRLLTPPGPATRPTSERVREAVFSRLDHLGVLTGARVLDLYAGAGSLGLEAASRGASEVVLVDVARAATAVAAKNVAALEVPAARVITADVVRYLARPAPPGPGFDVVLLDPPYELAEAGLAQVLSALAEPGWLEPAALVVVERSVRSPEPSWPRGWGAVTARRYGETAVWSVAP